MINASHTAVARHQRAWESVEKELLPYARQFASTFEAVGLVYFRFLVPAPAGSSAGTAKRANCDVCFVERSTSLWDTIFAASPEGKTLLPTIGAGPKGDGTVLICVGVPVGKVEGGDMIMSLRSFPNPNQREMVSTSE